LASRYQELRQSAPAKTKWLNSTVFKSTLRHDLVKDNELITSLLTRFGSWDSTRDSKVNALFDLLRGDHEGKKVLVFSEYKDTADLRRRRAWRKQASTTSAWPRATLRPVRRGPTVQRLGPTASRARAWRSVKEPDDPIDVLIATDVLSEGQNLQDSHVIVNYDLPWAIIRLIQRAGRVDRVGQESDTVHVYLITHDKVEQQIHLRRRIRARLSAAAEAFGSDEQFFGTDDEIKLLHDFYDGRLVRRR
jgi:superfamily II DNA/RNA helicase